MLLARHAQAERALALTTDITDPDLRAAREAQIVEALARWVNSGDCALPELFRQCGASSIGAFHDALRRLEAAGRVYLHPWTAPLYAIPEPAYALLAGHAVCYFASLNQGGSR